MTALVNELALDLLNAPPTEADEVIGQLRSGLGLILRACETRGAHHGAVGDCVRCTRPRGNVQVRGPQLREGRAQDVSAGWHD